MNEGPTCCTEKAILGCREEGVRRRPVRGSTHGLVEVWPSGGVDDGAYGGANDCCGGPGQCLRGQVPTAPVAMPAGAATMVPAGA
jgi:hypothetical protein